MSTTTMTEDVPAEVWETRRANFQAADKDEVGIISFALLYSKQMMPFAPAGNVILWFRSKCGDLAVLGWIPESFRASTSLGVRDVTTYQA